MADTTITITDSDRIEAENILEQYLSDKIPDGDFSKGGALRDLAIGSMAYIFAYLKKEQDYVRARQSLLLLGALSGTDVDDAVDEILSNWFITRKTGRKSTGTATLYLSSRSSLTISPSDMFYKTAELVFYPNISVSTIYSEDDLAPIVNSSGVVTSYSISIPLIAADVGTSYDIVAGPFLKFVVAGSVNIIRVENASPFSGGGDTETTSEMLERSTTAISVRDLNSSRSIDATLKEEFSDVQDVYVVGFGDPEMTRDVVLQETTGMRVHGGGMVDVYVRAPIVYSKTTTLEVGSVFSDNRPFYSILRDDTVSDFSSINPGDIVEVYNNSPSSEANRYFVEKATKYGVYVSARSPFPDLRPEVTDSGEDGVVSNGSNTFDAASHDFATIESTYYDGNVYLGGTYLESLTYSFTAADIGKWLQVRESSLGNNGTWKIVGVSLDGTRAELRDPRGIPPGFQSETSLTFDILLSSDIGKYIRIRGSTLGNNGTWEIYQVVSENQVILKNPDWTDPGFPADETALAWDLCTKVVDYSIGTNPPNYNNRVTRRISGRFTKEVQNDGRVLLPMEPIYRITDVSFADSTNPYVGTDGRVSFPNRSNLEPEYKLPSELAEMQYEVVCDNPGEAPSGWQLMELDIGWPDGVGTYEQKDYFNGKQLRVTYDALSGYDSVWAYMLSGDQRILCGSVIPKGHHPVYLQIDIPYRLTKNATSPLDTTAAASALAEYINSFDPIEDIDVSDIMAFLRNNYTVIGQIQPFSIYYHLLSPDGRVIHYKTTDTVSIDPELCIDPTTGFIPNPIANPELVLEDPLGIGVSDNTVRYLSAADLITFTNLG